MKRSSSNVTPQGPVGWPEACFEQFDPLDGQAVARARELKAYREGYAQGRRDALQEIERHVQPLEALLKQGLAECTSVRTALLQGLEREVVELVIETARKVVGQELRTAPEAILAVVRAALEKAMDQEDLALHVHPQDYALLAAHRTELLRSLEGLKGFRLIQDPEITPGGCLLETRHGFIDARLESRLAEAQAALLGIERRDS